MNRRDMLKTGAAMAVTMTTVTAAGAGQALAQVAAAAANAGDNPFFREWKTPFGAVPFNEIRDEHFKPAYDRAFEIHKAEIAAIADNPAAPTFANTIEAMERSGELLGRVGQVFGNLGGSFTNDNLQALQREIAPISARHGSEIVLNEKLFKRIDTLWTNRDSLGLNAEQLRVLERTHNRFIRAGAQLDATGKARMTEITARLATLYTAFGQNVLADEKAFMMVLDKPEDLAGLPEDTVVAAAQAAEQRGHAGKHVITLSRSLFEPFMTFSERRDLREKLFLGFINRGNNNDANDNKAVVAEIVALRAERAQLLGFPTFAHFRTADTMAGTPDAALELMRKVWEPARAKALADRAEMQALIAAEGKNFELAAWDWRHYQEKVRVAKYDFDEAALKPYLALDSVIEAAFYTANRLFGLTFAERIDIPVYSPDVRVWEVTDKDGRHVGLFYGDYFSRPNKRSGAWMSALRSQEAMDGFVTPHIMNNCNYNKPSPGEPALVGFRDAETLFHEFGHGLHGLLSKVTYGSIAGTAVDRDFVEFPAQIYEHWLSTPEILQKFARHYATGEVIPQPLLSKMQAARNFKQGFDTVEFLSTAFVDMEFHLLDPSAAKAVDPAKFEADILTKIGMPAEIVMRHRTTHLGHAFSGEGYSAGYYSYLWAGVLDTDGFAAFREAEDPFHPETARRLHDYVYSAGNSRPAMEAYVKFRGRPPQTDALLEHRGFVKAATGIGE